MDDIAMDNELALWDQAQNPAEKLDPIWTLLAYRLSRYALDLAKADIRQAGPRVGARMRDQLLRSVASVSANIGEAHSRPTARERNRFYVFALGSVREAIPWYSTI